MFFFCSNENSLLTYLHFISSYIPLEVWSELSELYKPTNSYHSEKETNRLNHEPSQQNCKYINLMNFVANWLVSKLAIILLIKKKATLLLQQEINLSCEGY